MKRMHLGLLAIAAGGALLLAPIQASAQAPPLGVAGSFGVLAGSTVTNTGGTAVTGELGVSPGTAVTGFPPGTVTGGTIHSNDATAQQAQADLTTAYNALAGLACNTVLTGQDLGGLTLVPGVYCFASSAQLTGTLRLDAQGNPSAQFIFKIGSTLTTASNSAVQLIGGGQNCNVYWQVGSSATLGIATQFAGNILALASITLTTGSNTSGRLLARTGAVTLDTNSVAICAACNLVTLAPATLPNGSIGAAYNQTITATGGSAPYAYTIVSGSLPPGLTLAPGGAISGVPTTAGSFTFTVRATDSGGCFGSRVYTIVINAAPCPTITVFPATLPPATAGVAYSQTITASGGTAPYTFAVSSGVLPPGLSLSSAGLLSGIPTGAGAYTFTITAMDAVGCLGSRVYTFNVLCPTIAISPATLPNGTVGVAYGPVSITASGGRAPYSFAVVSGSLPPGLNLSAAGSLSGTPTTAGSSTFTIRATDASGCFAERLYTLIVNAPACPTITVSPATLPPAIPGVAYSQTITASGGTAPYTFTLTSGALPPGLLLSSSGLLSGIPTSAGAYTFTVTATDAVGCLGSRLYTLNVICPTITISPATLPNGTVGVVYGPVAITASGGTAPYTFTIVSGSLPPGLTLSGAGVLSGTPTTAGSSTFTIRATDSAGCFAERLYTLIVNPPACPTITVNPSTLPVPIVGVAYSQTITASGGTAPYTFTVTSGALPPGLTLSSAGLLSGIPTTSGAYTFTITATDAVGCLGSRLYSFLVNCPVITISPATLPNGTVGVVYGPVTITASGGTPPYSFAIVSGSLPPGLTLSFTGILSGTPTTAASSTFTVRATDANGCFAERIYTLLVNAPACPTITVNPATLPPALEGVAYSQTITASGGTAPYTFAVTGGALPPGLTLSPGGLLSGIPTTTGPYAFTITATDSAGCLGSRLYQFDVNCPTVTVSPATLPAPVVGVPYSQTITASGGTPPYFFIVTAGALPPGLSLSSGGILSGTLTAAGSYSFTITATDAAGCAGLIVYSFGAGCPVITIAPSSLPNGTVGTPYSQTVTASGGTAPYTYAVTSGALPTGLSLNSQTGVISGTPTLAGTFTFVITATDANGCTAQLSYTVTIVTVFVVPAIPTLSEWGLMLLMVLLGFAGVYVLRRV